MSQKDIFTEPTDINVDTLQCLGPLRAMAGIWEGKSGEDMHPVASGTKGDLYYERAEMQPTDPQTNGPQLLYGLRYHIHITKPDEVETFHDQVGYWLWEPLTETVIQTVAIPRGQVALAIGKAQADAKEFELEAIHGTTLNGICSIPFLEESFKTVSYRIKVNINADGSWTYDQDTVLMVSGRSEPFHHTDLHTLIKIAEPTPNPLAKLKTQAVT
jgi:hypothetical protein